MKDDIKFEWTWTMINTISTSKNLMWLLELNLGEKSLFVIGIIYCSDRNFSENSLDKRHAIWPCLVDAFNVNLKNNMVLKYLFFHLKKVEKKEFWRFCFRMKKIFKSTVYRTVRMFISKKCSINTVWAWMIKICIPIEISLPA